MWSQLCEKVKSQSSRCQDLLRCTSCTFNALGANPKKFSNTLKQFVCELPANYFSTFDHFWGLALKGLMSIQHVEEGDLHEKVGRSSTPEEIIAETDDVVKYNNMVSNINESEVV